MSDLKSLCEQHVREIPAYNFMRKTEEPSNYLEKIIRLIAKKDGNVIRDLLHEVHFADIAELLEELKPEEAAYLIKSLESKITKKGCRTALL